MDLASRIGNDSLLDLRSLEVFVAVCNTRSMSNAAALLGITQGAVSQQIAKLEAKFGIPLLARRGRQLDILPAGTNLLFHARRILQEVRLCEKSLRRFNGYSYPDVSLTIINTMSKVLSTPLIGALDGLVEKIHLNTSVSMRHREEMMNDRIDILVSAQDFDPGVYEVHPIANEPLILLTPKDLIPRNAEVELERLAQSLPLAHFSGRRHIGRLTSDYLAKTPGLAVRSMEVDQSATIIAAVRRRVAWAIVTPFCLLDPETQISDIDIHMLPPQVPVRTINLIAKHGRFADLPGLLAARCRAHLNMVISTKLQPILPLESLPTIPFSFP